MEYVRMSELRCEKMDFHSSLMPLAEGFRETRPKHRSPARLKPQTLAAPATPLKASSEGLQLKLLGVLPKLSKAQ